jgi:hypothetical protein
LWITRMKPEICPVGENAVKQSDLREVFHGNEVSVRAVEARRGGARPGLRI